MVVAVLTHDIGQRVPWFLRVGMVQTPWQKYEGQEDNGQPLFRRFVRLDPKVGHASRLFDGEVVSLNGPALLRDAQDVLCRSREVGAQKILRVFVPRVPLTDEHTDVKRQAVERALERTHQGGPRPLVGSGQRHALIPLRPERLGPLGALLVIQLPMRLDRTHDIPALPATACAEAIGGIPTVEEHVDLASRGQQLVSLRSHGVGQRRLLAQAQALLRRPWSVETPHRLLAQGEPPIIRRGSGAECQADCHMHGPIGGVGCVFPLPLGVVMMVFDGFEMPCPLVLCAQRVIQAHGEGPMVVLLGIGHQVGQNTVAQRCAEVFGCPGTDTQRVRPMRGVGGIDQASIETGNGFMPYFRDNERISKAQHMLPLRLAQTQLQTTQKGEKFGRMLYNELEQGDSLSEGRFGLALLAYADILLYSIWAIHRIRQTQVNALRADYSRRSRARLSSKADSYDGQRIRDESLGLTSAVLPAWVV
jgi:hypothetical protein